MILNDLIEKLQKAVADDEYLGTRDVSIKRRTMYAVDELNDDLAVDIIGIEFDGETYLTI